MSFSHGIRVDNANEGVRVPAQQDQKAGPYPHERGTFLGLAQPDVARAATEGGETGDRCVIVIPFF